MTPAFKGCATALATPMKQDGNINYSAFKKLLEHQIAHGVDALVICGTTGEAPTLSFEEHGELIAYAVQVAKGRVPIIAGAGSNDTAKAAALAKNARLMGADALLVVTPYYNKTSQQGLIQHYKAVANCVDIPIIAYSVPSRTGMIISPEALAELSEITTVSGVKDASGDFAAYIEAKAKCREDFSFYSGNDETLVPFMSMGGDGIISVTANLIPGTIVKMCSLCLEGRYQEAAELQKKLWRLNKLLFKEPNPIPVKAAMNSLGFDMGPVRLPLAEASKELVMQIEDALRELGAL